MMYSPRQKQQALQHALLANVDFDIEEVGRVLQCYKIAGGVFSGPQEYRDLADAAAIPACKARVVIGLLRAYEE